MTHHHEMSSKSQNHQLDQIAPVGLKFQNEYLYDRNVWRQIKAMDKFDPKDQWKLILDLKITELFDQIPVNNWVLEYLCFKNHRDLLELLIPKDTNKWLNFNHGLFGACLGGHRDLAQWMMELGGNWWNMGLQGACRGGHQDLAQWMIDLGSKDWNEGLDGACRGGFKVLAQWMIDLGAKNLNMGLRGACCGRHRELAQWMIDLGATDRWLFNSYFPDL